MTDLPPPKKKSFVRKFFWEGQALEEDDEVQEEPGLLEKHKKYVAVLIPFVLCQTLWVLTAIRYEWFELFPSRWILAAVMTFGAMIAGMTSEGGGAVSFPVMTLALKIQPTVARDFALILQSIGMGCAAFSILYMDIQIEKNAIIYGCIGSIPGFVFGSYFVGGLQSKTNNFQIDPYLSPAEKKMLFVSIWGSFAIALYTLNSSGRRTISRQADIAGIGALVMIIAGFAGGCFTSFAGSGVDVSLFSVLTLFFRISEKKATPTTVVLMAINTLVGFYFRAVWQNDVHKDSWDYVKVCTPVVVLFAPLGSFLGSHFHRKTLAWLVYILETLAVLGFLITRPDCQLVLIGACIMFGSYFFFRFLTSAGESRLMKSKEYEAGVHDGNLPVNV